MKSVIVGTCILAFTAGAAGAATVNFAAATPSYSTSLDFGFFSVTPTAVGVGNQGADYVSQGQAGLGVLGFGYPDYNVPGTFPDAQLMDGRPAGSAEVLTFTFDSAVTLNSFTLSFFDANDDYSYSVNGGPAVRGDTAFNALGATGVTTFTIAAIGNSVFDTPLGNDEFGFYELDYTVAAVPVPASLGLLAAALGVIGAVRRRRPA